MAAGKSADWISNQLGVFVLLKALNAAFGLLVRCNLLYWRLLSSSAISISASQCVEPSDIWKCSSVWHVPWPSLCNERYLPDWSKFRYWAYTHPCISTVMCPSMHHAWSFSRILVQPQSTRPFAEFIATRVACVQHWQLSRTMGEASRRRRESERTDWKSVFTTWMCPCKAVLSTT